MTFPETHLNELEVYSTEGCIGNPLSSIAAEMLYTDRTDATAIQILSYESQRPGHILSNSVKLRREDFWD
jgi:hypothetical protein